MRIGFVGVGRHATKMAEAFSECGAEVVAHWRNYKVGGGFAIVGSEWGRAVPWAEQIASPNIDALIICAPPEVTTEVALACAKAGKRCVATKPLMVSDWDTSHPLAATEDRSLYVDLWRLYSPAWLAMKAELQGKKIQSVHVDFYGNGPVRSFSGLLDYGPHALAFVADLLGGIPDQEWQTVKKDGAEFWCTSSKRMDVATGNLLPPHCGPRRRARVVADGREYLFSEDDSGQSYIRDGHDCQLSSRSSIALRNFCRAFLAGEPSDTLRLICEAMRVLMPLVS